MTCCPDAPNDNHDEDDEVNTDDGSCSLQNDKPATCVPYSKCGPFTMMIGNLIKPLPNVILTKYSISSTSFLLMPGCSIYYARSFSVWTRRQWHRSDGAKDLLSRWCSGINVSSRRRVNNNIYNNNHHHHNNYYNCSARALVQTSSRISPTGQYGHLWQIFCPSWCKKSNNFIEGIWWVN